MRNILTLLFCILAISTTKAATQHDVEIIKFKFQPAEITIKAGDSVHWVNKEKRQYHNVWFEQSGEPEPDYLFPDDVFDKTFSETGDFPYRCGPHPQMTGLIHVISADESKDSSQKTKNKSADNTKNNEKTLSEGSVADTQQDIPEKRKEEILSLLRQDCGACHGMTLLGGLGPSLKSEALERLTLDQVVQTIMQGRPGTPMPPWKPFFSDAEVHWLAQQLKQGIEDKK